MRKVVVAAAAAGVVVVASAIGLLMHHKLSPLPGAARMFSTMTWDANGAGHLSRPGLDITLDKLHSSGKTTEVEAVHVVSGGWEMTGAHATITPDTAVGGGWQVHVEEASAHSALGWTLTAPEATLTLGVEGNLARMAMPSITARWTVSGVPDMGLTGTNVSAEFDQALQGAGKVLQDTMIQAQVARPTLSGGWIESPVTGDEGTVQATSTGWNVDIGQVALDPARQRFLAALRITTPEVATAHLAIQDRTVSGRVVLGSLGALTLQLDAAEPWVSKDAWGGTQPLDGLNLGWSDAGLMFRLLAWKAQQDQLSVDVERMRLSAMVRDHSEISPAVLSAEDIVGFLQGERPAQVSARLTPPQSLGQVLSGFFGPSSGMEVHLNFPR